MESLPGLKSPCFTGWKPPGKNYIWLPNHWYETVTSFFLFLLVSTITFSQITERQTIADSSFGWMKIHNYKGYKTSRTLGSRVFSATQLSICDSFCELDAGQLYSLKGCIGDVRKVIMPEIGLYNKHQQFAPQGYGATSYTWSLYMKDGKPTPIQETEIPGALPLTRRAM